MKETLQEAIQFAKDNWATLPKSTEDNGEFVIIAENDSGSGYEEYKECLGVRENGTLIWVYLSGCSCRGSCETSSEITSKTFRIDTVPTAGEFYKEYKCDATRENYASY